MVLGGSFPYSDIEEGSKYVCGTYYKYHYMEKNLQETFMLRVQL